jgi:hypothetical protein
MGDFMKNWRKHKEAGTRRTILLVSAHEAIRGLPYVLSSVAITALGLWLVEKFVLHENLHEWLMHILRKL